MSGKRIYLFSLSKEDEAFKDGKIETAVNWLENKDENPFYFRNQKPKLLPSGSIILFSFKAQIFGQATVKEEPRKLSLKEQRRAKKYKYSMILNGSSIEIFPEPYLKRKVAERKIGKHFGRFLKHLTSDEYRRVLEMAKVKKNSAHSVTA